MADTIQLRVDPRTAATPELLHNAVARELGIAPADLPGVTVMKRSIDARQRRVMVNLTVAPSADVAGLDPKPINYAPVPENAPQVIVVGAGPAGLFASLALIERGIRPVLLERGKDVDSRRRDMARIARENVIDPDSNYCFGEGGAGAYSDGKLYTRSKKRGPVEKILNILHQHGADRDILVDAHPHIGTDRLPGIIKAIRETIIRCGGVVKFGEKVTSLIIDSDAAGNSNTVTGVRTATGNSYHGPVILATGHSARDVYEFLDTQGLDLQAKGLAVGVRLEHPQHLIDSIQYHSPQGRGKYLPAAEYTMLTRVDGRAVYSFCMCPGGFIIPASSAPGQLVVNGMSPSNRGTRWANSGMVVEVLPEDVPGDDPLRMIDFQKSIEQRFFDDGDGTQNAPAQRMADFVNGRDSASLPQTSYAPGIHPARIDHLLPPGIATRLQRGFADFGRKSRGFLTNDAVLIGCETRTSSPVRIPRDNETLQHVSISGLYPCGEGAGYAGGIVSAAIDGDRIASIISI